MRPVAVCWICVVVRGDTPWHWRSMDYMLRLVTIVPAGSIIGTFAKSASSRITLEFVINPNTDLSGIDFLENAGNEVVFLARRVL